jgi:hypothetical protein
MKRLIQSLLFAAVCVSGWQVSAEQPLNFNPVKGYEQRKIHRLFPLREEDEAFTAQKNGLASEKQIQTIMQGASEDYFSQMDYGVTLPENQESLRNTLTPYFPDITSEEAVSRMARGRNNWIVWTAGNDRFWSYMTRATFGGLDLIKTISAHPSLPAVRGNRWKELGVVSEPCFEKGTGPRADRWGLWLDKRTEGCKADPFEDASKYPGLAIGSRGKTLNFRGKKVQMEVGSFYGYATGVVGLRLFPNPEFDQKAADKWDPARYYTDPTYYNDPNIIRPYRVGMACAFCHVGPNPSRPPADFENPEWANLSSNPGAQYFWVDRIFVWNYKKSRDNFLYQLLHTSRPGALDTSLISSDQINNPRTMNAVYDLPARVSLAAKMGHLEQLSGNEILNAQFGSLSEKIVPKSSGLRNLFNPQNNQVLSPRILKDGSDSVGALGALNRVYVNIGLFSENWVQNFIPLIGGFGTEGVSAFRIDIAQKKSIFWRATVNQTPDLALFFLAASRPDKLADAPGGPSYLKDEADTQIQLGKKVFANDCAQCHSGKLPEKAYTFFNKGMTCGGAGYAECWKSYWEYTKSKEFKDAMEKIVMDKDFLVHNYLSSELRVPDNVVDSQLCSPVGTNAIRGDIWDNFSSDSYKKLPSIGKFKVNFPTPTGKAVQSADIDVPDGGRGYVRPASLISIWTSAPFLQNNSLGEFDYRGSVEGRMKSFNDSINKLLNPELRGNGVRPGERVVKYTTSFGDQLPGVMDVTIQESYLNLPRGYLPSVLFNWIRKSLDENPKVTKNMINKTYKMVMIDETPVKEKNVNRSVAAYGEGTDDAADAPDEQMGEMLQLGPIPAGVPINLISNINLQSNKTDLARAVRALVGAIIKIRKEHLQGEAATTLFLNAVTEPLLKVSKCNDFIVNRGHYFGTKYAPKDMGTTPMTDAERTALIEYLKLM